MTGLRSFLKVAFGTMVLLSAALAVIFHQSLGEILANVWDPRHKEEPIATLIEARGDVRLKSKGRADEVVAQAGYKIFSGDTLTALEAEEPGEAIVGLEGGGQFELRAPARLVVESVKGVSPILITLQNGRLDFRETPPAGRVTVDSTEMRYDPAGRVIVDALQAPITGEEALVTGTTPETATELKPELKPKETAEKPEVPATGAGESEVDPNSLSDDYIQNVVRSQKPFFNRCYAEYISQNPKSKGVINMAFTIQPQGQVSDVRVIGGSIQDKRLHKCLMGVVERCRFRKFSAEAIVVNYPIQIE
jgi:hypothetical protein